MTDSDLRKLNRLQEKRNDLEHFLNLTHGDSGLKFGVTSVKIFPWVHARHYELELFDYPQLVNEILDVIKKHYELICEAMEDA